MAVIGTHYEKNNYFVPKYEIYKNMHKIKHIQTYIIDRRYDLITPMKMAFKLNKLFTNSKLMIVKGGHAVMEKEVSLALVKASDEMIKSIVV